MPSRLNPYLSFRDNAREAMEFYQSVFGGKLDMTTFKEFNVSEDPAEGDKIMHGMLEAPNGSVHDAPTPPTPWSTRRASTMSVSLSGDDEAELAGYLRQAQGGRYRDDAPGQGPVGRLVRDAHRQVRHRLAGEHQRAGIAGLSVGMGRPRDSTSSARSVTQRLGSPWSRWSDEAVVEGLLQPPAALRRRLGGDEVEGFAHALVRGSPGA